ncbi:GNAT family N-acetyltransferase [Microcoleus sp. FACHB-831]|uniref:GNAT family N-acetyltransferase n=1 Tax=Microcoleus sp. FACHB-831 TaxID=2692827 RepID=UPI001682D4C6|nr:GNAT family N-acetyltransferase [Microcoleus sp. FACHB-831]MBD1924258.1 GNAT family N-acetyltransferase [Microcoleus sp. FACHB-831]
MTSQIEYGSIANPEEAEKLGVILNQCFNSPPNSWQTYSDRIGLENFRIIRKGGELMGGLAIYHMGQYYGLESVPMGGIAAVGIAPEYRGSGAAIALMQHAVKELYAKGLPISVLYPATQRLYRKAGYEQGGIYCSWEIPTETIQIKDSNLPIKSVSSISHEVFKDLYHQQSKVNNGNLDRNKAIWDGAIKPQTEEPVYAYLIGKETQPEGYIILAQYQEDNNNLILIKDWVVLTAAAANTLWTFLAGHRSQIKKMRWRSSPVDPLTLLLPEQTANIRNLERWMLRVIDVPKALEKRGYPLGIETELHLQVEDELLPENNGKFVLKVSNGRGEVTKGGKGELHLDVRGLAPLYTGLFAPHQLQLAGKLEATETALSVATSLFAGSQPWLPDFF